MIQQLRANVFDIDLYKAIQEDANFGTDIQKLLQANKKQNIPDSLAQFLFDFKAFFNHICLDIRLKKTYDTKIHQKKREVAGEWEHSKPNSMNSMPNSKNNKIK